MFESYDNGTMWEPGQYLCPQKQIILDQNIKLILAFIILTLILFHIPILILFCIYVFQNELVFATHLTSVCDVFLSETGCSTGTKSRAGFDASTESWKVTVLHHNEVKLECYPLETLAPILYLF